MNTTHIPRKRFGQHFLVDTSVLNKIVSVFAPKEGQHIIEIGPGTGALTGVLLDRVSSLTAIELDRDLIDRLQHQFGSNSEKNFSVIQSDILKFDFSSLLTPEEAESKLRIVGNLPYNISTPLIFHLLHHLNIISDMVFMLQKEVALRLSATPNTKDYGRLTVMTSIDLHCECLFDVPPESFDPPPKVNSTILRLTPRENKFIITDRKHLSEIVTAAFSQRRKTIKNGLKKYVSDEQFEAANINAGQRAENLCVEDFIRLSNVCCQETSSTTTT